MVQYIGNLELNKLFHQPESRFGIARDGTMRATEVYECRTESFQALCYQLYSAAHPTMPYLGVDDVDGEEGEGGISRIIVKYAGYGGSGGVSAGIQLTETYSLRKVVAAEPIDTFGKFVEMSKEDRQAVVIAKKNFDETGEFPSWFSFNPETQLPSDAKSARFDCHINGMESYYEPGQIFVRKQVMNHQANFRRNLNIGKIDVPPDKAPKIPGRDWLYKGAEESTEGFARSIEDTWELSGPRGWYKYVYRKS